MFGVLLLNMITIIVDTVAAVAAATESTSTPNATYDDDYRPHWLESDSVHRPIMKLHNGTIAPWLTHDHSASNGTNATIDDNVELLWNDDPASAAAESAMSGVRNATVAVTVAVINGATVFLSENSSFYNASDQENDTSLTMIRHFSNDLSIANFTGVLSNDSAMTTGDDEGDHVLTTIETIGNIMSFYYVPVLVGTGSIGNILSVFVFFKSKLCKLSSSYYLAALAVSDTCFLSGLFAQWLNFVDINIYNRDFFCQFFTFFSSLASFCSAWFVVAFTVERFIAVMYPLRRQTMCTVRRAKLVLIGLITIGCLHCAPFWVLSTPVYSHKLEATICDIRSEYKRAMTLLNYWDTVVVFAIPFTIIFVLNTFTGCTVWKFATVRRTLTMQKKRTSSGKDTFSETPTMYRLASLKRQKSTSSQTTDQINSSRSNGDTMRKSRKRNKMTNASQLKVTKMLLIVSSVFVCLNLPSCVMRIKTFLETETSANEKTTVVLQYIFQLLFITNFGINFVLYCVSGQNFRKAVISVFRRVSKSNTAPQKEGTTQVTVRLPACRWMPAASVNEWATLLCRSELV